MTGGRAMASLLGSSIPFPCPACEEPMTVPLKEVGVDRNVLTVNLDLGPFRAHIAQAHSAGQTGGRNGSP